jgi:hypothetical protein
VRVAGNGRPSGSERAGDEQSDVASRELGAHGGCLAWDAGVVGSGQGPHFYATIRRPATTGHGVAVGMTGPLVR